RVIANTCIPSACCRKRAAGASKFRSYCSLRSSWTTTSTYGPSRADSAYRLQRRLYFDQAKTLKYLRCRLTLEATNNSIFHASTRVNRSIWIYIKLRSTCAAIGIIGLQALHLSYFHVCGYLDTLL